MRSDKKGKKKDEMFEDIENGRSYEQMKEDALHREK